TFPVRNAWYVSSYSMASGIYTVSADFLPGDVSDERRGGVAGWLNTTTQTGITLHVRPAGDSPSFRVATVNFQADNGEDNESAAHLFNQDGTAATMDIGSASAALGAYNPTNLATFQLAFTAPTTADKAALSGATAHVTAKVFQSNGSATPVTLATWELLTDLPVPAAASHRAAYYAYWGAIAGTGPIGYLDNLTTTGAVVTVTNSAPAVSLTGPTNNATYITPSTITFTATASDPDGTIKRVDFYANNQLVGSANGAPYGFDWVDATAGTYNLTARAVDNQGATTTSTNKITITVKTNTPPNVALSAPANGATFSSSADITITAIASDSDGAVRFVEFFADDQSLGIATDMPYSLTWSFHEAGTHVISVQATDDHGGVSTNSNPATVTLKDIGALLVTINSPVDGATFNAGVDVAVQIQATENGGTITNLTLLVDNVLNKSLKVSSNDVATATLTYAKATAGNHSLVASATDSFGQTIQSAPVNIVVNGSTAAPSLSIQESGGSVVISWPANATGYKLQSTPSLVPPVTWTDVNSANNSATIPVGAGARFFHLVK
ncbi:MAG TPA: Ig-like domain-containing protein, partial [Verrucomicrobiae bacterium]|nr:Ig-like domain-containing protein [Verrucomicrobiae bacterium]